MLNQRAKKTHYHLFYFFIIFVFCGRAFASSQMNLQEKIKKQYVFISVILPFKNPRMPLEVAIASMELVVSLTFSSRRTLVEIGGPLPTRE